MSDPNPAGAAERPPLARTALGWALVAVTLGYAGFLHHGLGPLPDGAIEAWSPRAFLIQKSWIEPFELHPFRGVAVFTLPAALLAAVTFALTASALARTLSLTAVLACALFSFYGLRPPGPGIWAFFGWRGSAVMLGLALCLAATISAPLLARSWLRLPVAARIAVYLPVFVGIVAMLRNVTGTDPSLRFAISPWPVIPLFGLNVGSVAILGLIGGMSCAAFSLGSRDPERAPGMARRFVGVVAAMLLPAIWLKLWHPTLPTRALVAVTGIAVLCVLATVVATRGEALLRRARYLACGFLLAVAPIAGGEAWAGFDYSRTREGTARVVIDALARYYEQHQEYPEDLSDLVEAGLLERIPKPRIGFTFIHEPRFQYQSFGNGYNLEFSSPDWVQCAYNPAWSEDEYWDDEEAEEDEPATDAAETDGDGEALGEAWSCPSSPPELW